MSTQSQALHAPALPPSDVLVETNPPLEILAISDHEWRLRDSTKPADDATSLLGFICRIGDVFEVVRIGAPRIRRYFASFDRAVDDVLAAIRPKRRAQAWTAFGAGREPLTEGARLSSLSRSACNPA